MWVNDTVYMITSKKYNNVETKMESSISLSDDILPVIHSFTIPVLRFREQMRYDYHIVLIEPRNEKTNSLHMQKQQ